MEWLNPIEWVAWLYGKFFQGHAWRGGAVVVGAFAVTGLIVWFRAVDKYNEEHPVPKEQTAQAAPGNPPAVRLGAHPEPLSTESLSEHTTRKHSKVATTPQALPTLKQEEPLQSQGGPPTVIVKGQGRWISTDDSINNLSGGTALNIEDQAQVESKGMKINEQRHINPVAIARQLDQFISEADNLQDVDIQAWNDKVIHYLRTEWNGVHAVEFSILPNVGTKKTFLKSWRDTLMGQPTN
jgi:hypothetical protein